MAMETEEKERVQVKRNIYSGNIGKRGKQDRRDTHLDVRKILV